MGCSLDKSDQYVSIGIFFMFVYLPMFILGQFICIFVFVGFKRITSWKYHILIILSQKQGLKCIFGKKNCSNKM